MKFKYNWLLLLSGLALTLSCAKEEKELESAEGAQPAPIPVVRYDSEFSVQTDEATRLYFDASDGYALKWTKDDRLLLSNGADWKSYYVKEGGDTRADLYITDGTDLSGSQFYAVFPYPGDINPYTTSDNLYHLVIPTSQSYTAGGFHPAAFPMVGACGAVKALQFKNAGAVLAIKPVSSLPSSSKITSIIVSANEPLAGACTATWDGGEGVPSVTSAASTSVTLDCGSGIDWGTTAYICVAPGTYSDFCVEVAYTNSTGQAHYTWRKDLTVSRSSIKKLTVDFTDVVDYVDLTTLHPVSRTTMTAQTANCYLITDNRGGKYRFPITVKGNGVPTSYCTANDYSTKISPKDIEEIYVYYRTGIGACLSTIFSEEPELMGDYICFKTKEIDSGTHSNQFTTSSADAVDAGTALIAISSNPNWSSGLDMNALWSWMIWYNPVVCDHRISSTETTYAWLNMNLGAYTIAYVLPTADNTMKVGYYYQWGRKDPFQPGDAALSGPFVNSSSTKASLADAVANPHSFYGKDTDGYYDWAEKSTLYYDYWNANQKSNGQTDLDIAKTMWDPCPAGYHVMSYEAAGKLMDYSTKTSSDTSLGIGTGYAINFPGGGRRLPTNDSYGPEFYCWLSVGSYVNGIRAGSSLHGYTTNDNTDENYHKMEVVSYNRSQGHTVRCEKE